MRIIKKTSYLLLATGLTAAVIYSCKKSAVEHTSAPAINANMTTSLAATVSLSQTFEVGSTSPKTAYDVSPTGSSSGDNVTLNGNSWNMYDALIGNSSSDLKTGTWSARVAGGPAEVDLAAAGARVRAPGDVGVGHPTLLTNECLRALPYKREYKHMS